MDLEFNFKKKKNWGGNNTQSENNMHNGLHSIIIAFESWMWNVLKHKILKWTLKYLSHTWILRFSMPKKILKKKTTNHHSVQHKVLTVLQTNKQTVVSTKDK